MPVTVKKYHAQRKREMRRDVAEGENAAFKFLVTEAQGNAPEKTGRLKRSIRQYLKATASKPSAAARVEAPYGRIVDQGTAFIAPTFFWTRALLAMQARMPEFFKKR